MLDVTTEREYANTDKNFRFRRHHIYFPVFYANFNSQMDVDNLVRCTFDIINKKN